MFLFTLSQRGQDAKTVAVFRLESAESPLSQGQRARVDYPRDGCSTSDGGPVLIPASPCVMAWSSSSPDSQEGLCPWPSPPFTPALRLP